jgi:hypothetical protein
MEVSVSIELNEEEIIKDKSFEDVLMKILEAIKNIKEENKETD